MRRGARPWRRCPASRVRDLGLTDTPSAPLAQLLRHVPGWLDPLVVGVPDARLPGPGRQAPWKDGALAATHNALLDDGTLLEVCHGIEGACSLVAVGGGEASPVD